MSEVKIENFLMTENINSVLEECLLSKQYYLGVFLGRLTPVPNERYYELMASLEKAVRVVPKKEEIKQKIVQKPTQEESAEEIVKEIVEEIIQEIIQEIPDVKTRVKIMCNWCTSEELMLLWDKMSKGNCTWNNLQLVMNEPIDFYVIINAPPANIFFDPKKTVLFRMEPNMTKHPEIWREWTNPKNEDFFRVCKHEEGYYNNVEWHLSKTYQELTTFIPRKNTDWGKVISAVLSGKYSDPGHIKRVDFIKFLEKKLPGNVHVYGDNKWNYTDYKGVLPPYCKDEGIFPYKYTFAVENQSVKNYFTEKLIDCILGESLCFYCGCFNVKEYIDERAFVQLELSNFEKDYEIIRKAVEENWYERRLPHIREAKRKILTDLQFFPRLEKILI